MFHTIKNCLCCDSKNLLEILNLKEQPLANSYHKDEEVLCEFPLSLNLCLNCKHTQLSIAVDPSLMFKNYLYVSGTTKTLRDYFEWFANHTHAKIQKNNNCVLDIGCNDGSQLMAFKKLGYEIYGVDPAENLAFLSKEKQVNLTIGYWNENIAKTLPKFSVITAQNIFAHNDNPYDFLLACKIVMNEDSRLFIQTSQANMFENNEFDTIYHEHISFFSINSMFKLCQRAGFVIEDVVKPSIHGTSYVFTLKIGEEDLKDDVLKKWEEEQKRDIVYFQNWAKNAKKVVTDLKNEIENYKKLNYKVVGYGAAAKGNTLLNFGNISLDYIVDDNDLKQELLTPGMNIPIKPPKVIANEIENLVVVPLAWNFFAEIKQKIKEIRGNKKTKLVFYFPHLKIEEV